MAAMPVVSVYEHLLHRRYGYESRADQIHKVTCTDGVRLAVKRFLPKEDAPKRHLPVLCVPGLGADSHNFDAPGPWGLASALAEQGYDTWVVDLRGTGQSTLEPGAWRSVYFDDYIGLDLPAVIEHVLGIVGREQLFWVGHSMGGMALYAALATGLGSKVRAGVTLGSPVGFPQRWDCMPPFRRLHHLAPHIPGLHVRRVLRWLTPLCLSPRDMATDRWAVRDNVDAALVRRLLYTAVQDVPRGLALQFRDWIHHDAFRSKDLAVDYRARMAGTRVPVLVVCGPKDQLGAPTAVRRARDLLPHHDWLELGRAQGFSTDYGHVDMLFGRRAPEEVFPHLLNYLAHKDASDASTRPRLRRVV